MNPPGTVATVAPTIGEVLPAAVAIGLSPIAIIAVVAVLGGTGARRNGPLFAVGWVAGLMAIALVGTLVLDQVEGDSIGERASWADWVRLALGVVLIVAAILKWRSRPRPGSPPPDPPGWMRTIDGAGAGRTLVIGLLLGGVNPKNVGFGLAAAASIAGAQLDPGGTAVLIVVFAAIGSIAVVGLVLMYVILGERSDAALASVKEFMVLHGNVIMMVLFLVIGAKVLGDSIQELRR
jgi:threonine/homoserine/homoserine lactone efflux protein